jgi:cytochrome c556
MRKMAIFAALAMLGAGFIYADHTYEGVAKVHDIMAIVQKPSMDQLAAIMKAGGPQSDDDWENSAAHAAILAESTQLLLMGGRVKDDVWSDGATAVIAGAKATVAASEAKDLAAWKAGLGQVGKGCRTCHKVHKPKKGETAQ